MKEKFIAMGWLILEHRCRYYVLDNAVIDDYSYDMLEKAYKALAKELGVPPYSTDMVGFDESRHSCQMVMKKLGCYSTRGKVPKSTRRKRSNEKGS